ncbi:MAG: HEAT repeat domain-containing protein, partial [Planctomycetia bacterium]|nr:HEAT repeat domain-containing protein [Planctomycetia bacterium]
MLRMLRALALVLCLAGCGKSPPPPVVENTNPDNGTVSVDPLRGKPVEHWIGVIRGLDDEAASRAAGYLAEAGEPAVPALIEAMKDPSEKVRAKAVVTLGRIPAKATLKPLIAAFQDDACGDSAVEIVVKLDAAAVPELTTALTHESPAIRGRAAQALAEIGSSADESRPALLKALQDKEPKVRARAAEALARIGPAQEDEAGLVAALKDENPEVRSQVAAALGKRGTGAGQAVTPLLNQLQKDKNEDARAAAAGALGKIRPRTNKDAVAALRAAAAKDPQAKVRAEAVAALGDLGKGDKDATKSLVQELISDLATAAKDRDANVRRNAAQSLGGYGSRAEKGIPALTALVSDPEGPTRLAAVTALGKIGEPAVDPGLVKAVRSQHPDVRKAGMEALMKIGAEAYRAVPAVAGLLQDEDPAARADAAEFLGVVGPNAEKAVKELAAVLDDPNDTVRSRTADALGKIGKPAVPALIQALQNTNAGVRNQAATALAAIGEDGKAAVPALAQML